MPEENTENYQEIEEISPLESTEEITDQPDLSKDNWKSVICDLYNEDVSQIPEQSRNNFQAAIESYSSDHKYSGIEIKAGEIYLNWQNNDGEKKSTSLDDLVGEHDHSILIENLPPKYQKEIQDSISAGNNCEKYQKKPEAPDYDYLEADKILEETGIDKKEAQEILEKLPAPFISMLGGIKDKGGIIRDGRVYYGQNASWELDVALKWDFIKAQFADIISQKPELNMNMVEWAIKLKLPYTMEACSHFLSNDLWEVHLAANFLDELYGLKASMEKGESEEAIKNQNSKKVSKKPSPERSSQLMKKIKSIATMKFPKFPETPEKMPQNLDHDLEIANKMIKDWEGDGELPDKDEFITTIYKLAGDDEIIHKILDDLRNGQIKPQEGMDIIADEINSKNVTDPRLEKILELLEFADEMENPGD